MNIRSFDKGKEEHSSGKGLSHEADPMVDELVDVPLQEKHFRHLLVSCKDCRFFTIELPVCGLGGDGIWVVV